MNYASLMLYIVITCITPGPNNIMCMYLGAHCGLRGARKFMTASIAMFFIKMLLCGAGRCAARNSAVPQVAGGGIYAVFSHTHTYGRLQKKAG